MIKKYGEPKHYINRPLCRFDIINYFIEKNNYLNYLELIMVIIQHLRDLIGMVLHGELL